VLAVDDRIQDCIGKGFSCDPAALWQELLSPVLEQARSSRHPVTVDAAQRARWPWPVAAGLAVAVDAEQVAVLMVGSPLGADAYDDEDMRFLHTLGVLLQVSLRFALAGVREELLSAQLVRRNEELDRQILHLRTQRELAVELGQGRSLEETASRAVPIVLGGFAYTKGVLVLVDRQRDWVLAESRGTVFRPDKRAADALLFACLSRCATKQVPPLHVEEISLEDSPEMGLDFTPRRGFFFQVREGLFGGFVLGDPLQEAVAHHDSSLLACMQQLVLHLHGADAFATIVALNRDLEERNLRLEQMVEELTAAQSRITKLEQRVRHVLGALEDKAWQVTRARVVDFVFLVLLSAALGFAFNSQNPQGVELLPPSLPPSVQVVAAIPKDAVVVDARPRQYFERGSLPGAVNVPPQFFDLIYPMLLGNLDPEQPVVVFGRTWSRLYDVETARLLVERGHEAVSILEALPEARP
jgi:rhodanese-related sulfurtransferase